MRRTFENLHTEFVRSLQAAQQKPAATEQLTQTSGTPAAGLIFDSLDMDVLNTFSFDDDLWFQGFDMDSLPFCPVPARGKSRQDSGYGTNSQNGLEQ
jgi:hypothetical protein